MRVGLAVGEFWDFAGGVASRGAEGADVVGGVREDRENLFARVGWEGEVEDGGVVVEVWGGAVGDEDGGQIRNLGVLAREVRKGGSRTVSPSRARAG